MAEVSFAEWTRSGRIRHAVFRGLRNDKPAAEIILERAVRVARAKPSSVSAERGPQALSRRVHVTNPDRVIDTRTGTNKIELARYYELVGDLMMKHLKGRPVSLLRAPTGVDGQLFFQKRVETEKLPGLRQLDPALSIGDPAMIEVANARGLLSAAQWNVVEFQTQNTGTASFEHPDRMVFDLDPGTGVPWAQVQEAARRRAAAQGSRLGHGQGVLTSHRAAHGEGDSAALRGQERPEEPGRRDFYRLPEQRSRGDHRVYVIGARATGARHLGAGVLAGTAVAVRR